MVSNIWSIILTLLTVAIGGGYCDAGVAGIYAKILNNHNPLVSPSQNTSVNFSLDWSSIHEINTKTQILTAQIRLNVYWNDPTLSWSQKQFPGIYEVNLPSSKIWTPNIVLWNSVDENYGVPGVGNRLLTISSTGQVHWPIFQKIKSSCTIDVTYYPFDQQTCVLKFGATDNTVHVGVHDNITEANLSEFYPSVMWGVVEAPVYTNQYVTPGRDFIETDVTFYLTVRRMTLWVTQVYPLLFMGLLTLLPCIVTQFIAKLIIQLVCLAGLFVLNKDASNTLPATQLVLPLSVFYTSLLTIINMIHIFLTCLLSNIDRGQFKLIPREISNKVRTLLCLSCTQSKQSELEVGDTKIAAAAEESDLEIVHRLISLALFIAVIISTLYFLLVTPYLGEDLYVETKMRGIEASV